MATTPTKLDSLSVFFPCFNEEKNVAPLVEDLTKILPLFTKQFEIIIINDGSLDNTGEIADRLARQSTQVRVIHHPKNLGYGASLQSGFKAARHKWTFYTDGDRQFDVKELQTVIPYTRNYQVIIGYRKNRAEGNFRAFNAFLYKLYIDALYRLHVKDIDCAFKLIQTELTQSIDYISTGAMVSAELLYRLKKTGKIFKQLPVTHYPRQYGTPTGNNPKVVIKAGVEALKLYTHMKFSQ